jgi:hypothetical protein
MCLLCSCLFLVLCAYFVFSVLFLLCFQCLVYCVFCVLSIMCSPTLIKISKKINNFLSSFEPTKKWWVLLLFLGIGVMCLQCIWFYVDVSWKFIMSWTFVVFDASWNVPWNCALSWKYVVNVVFSMGYVFYMWFLWFIHHMYRVYVFLWFVWYVLCTYVICFACFMCVWCLVNHEYLCFMFQFVGSF